jgi:hypothetical protein
MAAPKEPQPWNDPFAKTFKLFEVTGLFPKLARTTTVSAGVNEYHTVWELNQQNCGSSGAAVASVTSTTSTYGRPGTTVAFVRSSFAGGAAWASDGTMPTTATTAAAAISNLFIEASLLSWTSRLDARCSHARDDRSPAAHPGLIAARAAQSLDIGEVALDLTDQRLGALRRVLALFGP